MQANIRRKILLRSAIAAFVALIAMPARAGDEDFVKQVLDATDIQGGFVVHLGAGDGKLTALLRANDRFQVHGLDRHATNVTKARKHIQALGRYGDVAIDRLAGSDLPYIDNMVNLLVAETLDGVRIEEVMRVLAPGGAAYFKEGDRWVTRRKQRPSDIDEWTHYLHDASGNAVAHDDQVGPPRHLQWLGSPRWSRHHDRMASMSAMVSAGGRVFYIMDEGSRTSIQMPPKWMLIARDAFNGTILWKQPIPTWHNHLWPLKSGPTQLARRLVATRDTVFVTLGFRKPLTALDAGTGQVLRTYPQTDPVEEVIHEGGVLFAVVNQGETELTKYGPQLNLGDQGRVGREFKWNERPRRIVAVKSSGGEPLWTRETIVVPLTLAADQRRAIYHDGTKLVCLDRMTGKVLWNSAHVDRRQRITFNFGPKLVIHGDIVLFAGGDRTMRGLNIETGEELWTAPHAQSGYQSPEDLLVSGGLVWNAPTTRTQDSGVFQGRDPHTGEVKVEFAPDVETYWFHHRCYIAKATDKFLLPSRTGIEFVDTQSKHWDINHWVRGGCLYGIMPCNGLVYAPPHNCACYPEAKLYGMNALAPTSASREVPDVPAGNRLERGPAFGAALEADGDAQDQWPTYRHDNFRSGAGLSDVPADVSKRWEIELGGRLSAPTVAAGKLYVAQPDRHTVHALDANTGKIQWSYTTGSRVDSPPTYDRGRLLFGSADGWVYCLRAADGELVWRFRAAPVDRRLMAFEQLESVWPVHGSVLVQNNEAWFVAGRSNYLDGGLRLFRLKADTGEIISKTVMDQSDPESGENLQERLKILNMPVGLTDVLSSDGKRVFMRSQEFDLQGNRRQLGPHSGQAAQQGAVQRGETSHLFAPMGYLDDTYFHRAYWVYGRSFAGGHSGYYQAGKYAPSGRILVSDKDNVYGFGRKPQYYKWTTTIEHQLFSASKQPPKEAVDSWAADAKTARRTGKTNMVRFEKTKQLDPTNTPLAVEAWVNTAGTKGVVVARGGPALGYALWIKGGRPQFTVRTSDEQETTVSGPKKIVGKWAHLVGVLGADKRLDLYVDGKRVATGKAPQLIPSDPAQSLEIGADDGGAVGDYQSPNGIVGVIDEVRLYHGKVTTDDVMARFARPDAKPSAAKVVLSCALEAGKAEDASGNRHHGAVDGAQRIAGKHGQGLRFRGTRGQPGKGSFVDHHWDQNVPLLVRAMLKANDKLFIAGPPDLIDEESTFQRTVSGDPAVMAELAEQDDALEGKFGAILQVVSATDGSKLAEYKLESLPTWDGLAAANGRLHLTTTDGRVLCFGAAE